MISYVCTYLVPVDPLEESVILELVRSAPFATEAFVDITLEVREIHS